MNLPAAPRRIVGAKLPLRPMHVWTIRLRLQIERRVRDLALFDIALDSKLRGCDVVALRLADIMAAGSLRRRATSSSRRPAALCNSRLQSRHGARSLTGLIAGAAMGTAGCFRAECIQPRTCPRANISGSSNNGCR